MLDYLRIVLGPRLSRKGERGASAVEYALLITGIAGVIVLVVYAFGGMLSTVFSNTCQNVATHAGATSNC